MASDDSSTPPSSLPRCCCRGNDAADVVIVVVVFCGGDGGESASPEVGEVGADPVEASLTSTSMSTPPEGEGGEEAEEALSPGGGEGEVGEQGR